MGSKYTTQATSGYNASPPPDDGSQSASNLITWAGIKAKIGDVLKTFAEAINSALVSAFDYSVRQITTSDSTVVGDHMRCVEIAPTVTTAVTVSLGDAATMTNIYRVFVKNSSAINQTLGRVTVGDTIDGSAADLILPPGAGIVLQTNNAATGYLTVSRSGPFSDGVAVVAGGTDGTKKVRFEVDGLTTATTRVITVPDADITLGLGAAAGVGQTFLGSDVSLNDTANYFNVVNTGSIGASGQKWLIQATACVLDTAAGADFVLRIWDTSTVFVETDHQTINGAQPNAVTLSAIISPSAAATYHLSIKDRTAITGKVKTTGNSGTANKATSITAIRLV